MKQTQISALLIRNAELRAALTREIERGRIAFAPCVPATVAPVEVAPAAWEQARDEAERTLGSRLVKFFR